ncbi:MAG: TIGR04283 family arsenosugar biosynthesis glycosyltransferase [Burkholderiales bacterium]|jgi:rSAM/selenodomain-associated transferase 2
MKLSVIVPMLNEAELLASLLDQLQRLAHRGAEIILADGGSEDGSPSIAERAGFTVLHAARGRARQMNAAAAQATGDVLLFLHADSQLPDEADRHITQSLSTGANCWGRFDVRISGRPYLLRLVSCLMNIRSRITGIATGDQAMFVMRTAFDAVGGFPDQPLMEDIELSKRLLVRSRPACIARRVVTSGRRWERDGVWRTILLMWRLRWDYWRGVPAQQLAKVYR